MAASEKTELFSRLQELHAQQGKTWNEIEDVLRAEGYDLTANALRKRYTKWSKTETRGISPVASEPVASQAQGTSDFERLQKSRMDSYSKRFEKGPALPVLSPEAIASSIASLVDLNRQLLEQVRESNKLMRRLERRLQETDKTSHTEHTYEQPVTTRDLFELLKEMSAGRGQQMQYIEEERKDSPPREEVQQLIDGIVEEKVESELKIMLSGDGSFSKELAHLIDRRLKELFSGAEPVRQTPHAGPGRGKKGKSHIKFSASLESNLYARAKSLPGQFSRHLANALSTYLSVMEEKKED